MFKVRSPFVGAVDWWFLFGFEPLACALGSAMAWAFFPLLFWRVACGPPKHQRPVFPAGKLWAYLASQEQLSPQALANAPDGPAFVAKGASSWLPFCHVNWVCFWADGSGELGN